jgi:hypothetical protein
MILEVFRSKPPLYQREILLRKESDGGDSGRDLIDLLALGESHQDEANNIHYHILFQENEKGGAT